MSLATLNGQPVTALRVCLPAYGLWWAEVECASDQVLKGAAQIVLDDLTLKGTVVTGGAYQTRTRHRIVGGAGGWGKQIPAQSYTNDLGVKRAIVLRDAAAACGESMGPSDPKVTVGASFVRAVGPASRVLEQECARNWYVDELGITQIGRRPAVPFTGAASRMVNDAAQNRYEIAPGEGTVSKLLPGIVVDGIEAVDVEHLLDESGLRTTIWGRGIAETSRLSEAMRRIVEAVTAGSKYFGAWEYRVVRRNGERLDLQTVRVSSGMPDLRNVRIRPGAAGVRSHPVLGSLVEVVFLNGDPGQPRVVAFDDQDGTGFVADEITLQAGPTGTTAGAIEHATSAEALTLAVQTTINTIGNAITGAGGVGAYLGGVISALATDATFAGGVLSMLAAGALGTATKTALLAAMATKSADTGGDKPGLGWPAVRGG